MKKINIIFFYCTAFAIILLAAIVNGFPLWYPDTSTYLASGFELETPADRPIAYGLFLRIASLNGLSVWLIILTQALIVYYILNLTFKCFFSTWSKIHSIITLLLLSIFSSFSFVTSQLITDLFSPIGALCLFHFFFNKNLNRSNNNLVILIYIISVVTHMSHIGINLILIVILSILSKIFFGNFNLRKSITFSILTLACLLTMGSALGKSTHVFLMARLSENGILKKYLDENCNKKDYKICAFKDNLPTTANAFLWEKYSPVYHTGGWVDSKPEYAEIIRGTFSNWEYIKLQIIESFKTTRRQLTLFEVGDGNIPYKKGTSLYDRFQKYFPREFNQYKNSYIYRTEKELTLKKLQHFNTVNYLVAYFSILIIALFLFFYKKKKTNFYAFAVFMIATVFVTNFINASLVVNAHRFGAKVSWLLLLTTILIFFHLIKKQNENTE